MKEADEHEQALFLNASDGIAQDKSLSIGRPTEVKYDLSKSYEKRLVRSPDDSKLILLTIFDHLLVVTVVIVNVVAFWRGLFGIFSQFRDLYHLFFLYLLGSTVIFHFTIARNTYKRHLINNDIGSSILRKGYTYVFGCSCVAQWAGLWYFLDEMSGFDVYPPLVYSIISSGILICIKLYRNVLAPPVTFCTDRVEDFFEFPTVFNSSSSKQESLQRGFRPDKHRILYYVVSRLYTHLYSIACVNLWRGGWKALDFYSGTGPIQVVVPTAISLAALIGMKTMRNLSSTPLAVLLDRPTAYFQVPTMFKLRGTSDTSLYVLDCFFSVFVIGSLVVFVWRGVWCLTDVFLYPENEKFSAFGSLAIGYGIIIIVFSVQVPMESLCGKLAGFRKLLVADLYVFISFIGTINLWRGIWNLLNIYFLPESPILSCWITHLGSFAFLVLINCSNSTLVRGVYLDGEDGGKCVAFPVSYLRLIFKKHLVENEDKSDVNHKKCSPSNNCVDVEKTQKENPENGTDLAN